MATIHVCDRCGAVNGDSQAKLPVVLLPQEAADPKGTVADVFSCVATLVLDRDLCPSCWDSLAGHLGKPKG